jgi:hypothetical protein
VSRDRSVTRSAQDDDFVRDLENTAGWIRRKHVEIEKVTGSQDDGFVRGLEIRLVGYDCEMVV